VRVSASVPVVVAVAPPRAGAAVDDVGVASLAARACASGVLQGSKGSIPQKRHWQWRPSAKQPRETPAEQAGSNS